MYCLARLCRICVTSQRNMKSLHSADKDSISLYKKLITCVPELKAEKLSDQTLLCDKCCQKLNNLYAFRHLCTRNKRIFEGYISQLKQGTYSREQAKLVINIEKVKVFAENEPNMTVPINEEQNLVMDNFVFDLSPADELKAANCVRVEEMCPETSLPNESMGNIEDLSRSSSEIIFYNFDMETEVQHNNILENTDGEIRIERDDESMIDDFEAAPELTELNNIPSNDPVEINLDLANQNITIIEPTNVGTFQMDPIILEPIILNPATLNSMALNPIALNSVSLSSISLDSISVDSTTVDSTSEENVITLYSGTSQEKTTEIVQKTKINQDTKIKCEKCDKIFKDSDCLKRHKSLVHNEDKPLKCTKCEKRFQTQFHLQRHMTTHIVRPFRCDTCSQCFTCSTSLKRHKFLHSDNPNFQCDFCAEKFMSPANLKHHIIKQHDGQIYKCELCMSVFNKMYDLKAHERTHTGKKLHECDVCKKQYFSANSLRRHKKEVHEKSEQNGANSNN